MSHTALIVEVPEAEAIVSDLRKEFDKVSLSGMPAHITVLYPFLEKSKINELNLEAIKSVFRSFKKFSFQLSNLGEFPETVYLAPSPKGKFVELTQAIEKKFPDYPPFGGVHDSIIPHLSILNGDKGSISKVKGELEKRLNRNGPIESSCTEISLFEFYKNRWSRVDVIGLS